MSTRSDILTGKIKNKDLVFCFLLGSVSYLAILFLFAGDNYLGWSLVEYLKVSLINFFIAVIVAYSVWDFGLWTAGDSKLFMVFSYLVPVNFYVKGFVDFFPGLVLLINIFIPAALFIFVISIINLIRWLSATEKDHKFYRTFVVNELSNYIQVFELRKFLTSFLFVLALSNIFMIILGQDKIILFLGLFIVSRIMQGAFKERKIFYMSLILCLLSFVTKAALVDIFWYNELKNIIQMIVFVIIIFIINRIVDFYIYSKDVETVGHKGIAPKMVLADDFVSNIKRIAQKKFSEIRAEGINEDQASFLRSWALRNDEKVKIYRTMPFAPWIFGGVILTLVLKQSVLHLFLAYIR